MSRVKNITTQSDYDELSKAYKFVPDDNDDEEKSKRDSRWQDRMVRKYHEHLYKTHVIADLSQFETSKIGLRWRTKSEVASGKANETCGNKHCPCYFENNNENNKTIDEVKRWKANPDHRQVLNQYFQSYKKDGDDTNESELQRLAKVPHGLGLFDYEVHFAYEEQGEKKEELVNLKLCLRCAPKLFYVGKGYARGARSAREKQTKSDEGRNASYNLHRKRLDEKEDDHFSENESSPCTRTHNRHKIRKLAPKK